MPRAAAYAAGLIDSASSSARAMDWLDDRALAVTAVELILPYCLPEEATLRQVTDVFCNYLRDTPQERHRTGPNLFDEAMEKAWPCPRQDRLK